ncbi:MAG: bifunctional folylpolyglutamate synthase/dihydrofolate synthase [Minwuiales bacterium]|nr:bifunctional folylpolyglutamate synthase/dihydrofolate synthase [Minwuiales bacterium]
MALHPKSIDLSLDRMWGLLERLGNPHQHLPPVIHVAGTNGKGSVLAYLRAMLEAAGKSVHVYTSPHLVRFAERVRLAGEIIDEDHWSAVLERCETLNGDAPVTFFEVTTAAAFLAFSETPADFLLLETGLGGRLDATNVVDRPLLNIITPIAIDHVQYLGDTVSEIAGEKAGIMRRGVPCVLAPQDAEPEAVFVAKAAELGVPLSRAGADWRAEARGPHLVWRNAAEELVLPRPALAGQHQIDNAATAVAAMRLLGDSVADEAAIAAGLTGVEWPGRLQRLTVGPLTALAPDGAEIWLDGGHNVAAGGALAEALRDFAARDPERRPLHLIVGMLNSKDPTGFLESFADMADGIDAIAIPGEQASLSAEEVASAAAAVGLKVRTSASLSAAMMALREDSSGGPPPRVLVCGSLYLAGAVLAENA